MSQLELWGLSDPLTPVTISIPFLLQTSFSSAGGLFRVRSPPFTNTLG